MSIELLLPAGSYETFTVAVNNGADAVYIGGSSFSARANAVNFSDEEIVEAVKYAHIRGAKVYVALNTLIEDECFDKAFDFALFCYQNGVDALIVQDIGLLKVLRQCLPDFRLNASTQMTIHNLKGVRAAQKAGFSRVVLSRELSRDEIGDICSGSKVEIEVFAHGALCMSYSGQCLMSSLIGGRSGNRGACAQPCRMPYSLVDGDGIRVCTDKYLLSLKDLCLAEKIADMQKLGVSSLKIEGRMKNAEYVALATYVYDKCRKGRPVDKADISDLEAVFSRSGFTDGYYMDTPGREMFNIDKNNDKVYENITDATRERVERLCRSEGRKIPVSAAFEAECGKKAKLCVWDEDGNFASAESSVDVEPARNVALDEQRIREQLLKTGGTPFVVGDIGIALSEKVSLPIKEINAMRRLSLSVLAESRCKKPPVCSDADISFEFNIIKGGARYEYSAGGRTYQQIKALTDMDISRIYVPENVYKDHKEEFSSERFFVKLPAIEYGDVAREDYKNVCMSNFSQIYEKAEKKHAGARLNVFNSMAVKFLAEQGFDGVTLSPELNLRQVESISKDIDTEAIVYGYLPAMLVRNDVVKTALGKSGEGPYYLRDRKGAQFRIFDDKAEGAYVILNSTPLYMADKMQDLCRSGLSYALLDFTVETPDEIKMIFDLYKRGMSFDDSFTRGHFYRGV